jgi:hypothetical protein
MAEIPSVKIKVKDLKPSYTLLQEMRDEVDAPVVKGEAFTK